MTAPLRWSPIWIDGRAQGAFQRPSISMNAGLDSFEGQPRLRGQLVKLAYGVLSPVVRLLLGGSPANVAGFVAAFIVNPINRVCSAWARAKVIVDVVAESLIAVCPRFVHGDSALGVVASIAVMKPRDCGSAFYVLPQFVKLRTAIAMRHSPSAGKFSTKTATARSGTTNDGLKVHHLLCSAVTAKQPSCSLLEWLDPAQCYQAAIAFTRYVSFPHRKRHSTLGGPCHAY
jgi:hypothetical protein